MMTTRCPNCATTFRVTPEQIKVMQGKVRCGQCQQVFNAIDTLLDVMREPVASTDALPDLPKQEDLLQASATLDDAAAEIRDELPASQERLTSPLADQSWQSEEIEPLLHEGSAARRRAWPWALASALALSLLVLQAIMHFRVELSVLSPDAKSMLQALCMPFDCDIPLPRKGDLISIESSELRPDAAKAGQLVLAATLKNRAPFAQTYPHLELTLTDTADRPLLRKILAPEDYLSSSNNIEKGFARHGEITVNLALRHDNFANAEAAGYRLYLFYL